MIDKKPNGRDRSRQVVGVAWYSEDAWRRIRALAPDPDTLEESYDAWLAVYENGINTLEQAAVRPEKIEVDAEEFRRWCDEHGRALDSAARAAYAAERLRVKYEGGDE